MCYFQNVESKFRLHVRELVFFIRHGVAVFRFSTWDTERDGAIHADGVAFVIRGVVSEGPERKSIAVKILGIVQKSQNKVSAPYIVRQVAEEKTSVRVITHVLDNRPAIRIAVCYFEFFRCGIGKTLQQ